MLPQQTSSFIGRQAEIDAAVKRMAATRLLTLPIARRPSSLRLPMTTSDARAAAAAETITAAARPDLITKSVVPSFLAKWISGGRFENDVPGP